MSTLGQPIASRLAFFSEAVECGCRLWHGATDKDGYGRISYKGRTRRAHRVAWEIANGRSLGRRQVLHTCDTPACIEPTHLLEGTPASNMADRNAKGRHARGERQGHALLTEKDIIAIRASRKTQRQIGKEFGVCQSAIYLIKKRKNWAHIP